MYCIQNIYSIAININIIMNVSLLIYMASLSIITKVRICNKYSTFFYHSMGLKEEVNISPVE